MTLAPIESPDLEKRVEEMAVASAAARLLLERVAAHGVAFRLAPDASALELVPPPLPGGKRNRALVKCFRPDDRRLVAFFYKRSQVPGSRDRYAYGSSVMLEKDCAPERVDRWLDYVASGFDPECRPSDMRRAVPYDVPEDSPEPKDA